MKKTILSFLLTVITVCSCQSPEPRINTQDFDKPHIVQPSTTETAATDSTFKFDIDQDFVSIGSDFTVSSGGVIEERMLNATTTFEYKKDGSLVAKAKESMFSWGVEVIIYDGSDNKIGSVEEEIIDGLFSMNTIYSIKNADGNVVGKSKKLDFVGTDIDIYDNDQNLVVTMDRPMFNVLADTWHVTVHNKNIDTRLVMFIPCYKTYADDKRSNDD
jgi:uncharacterized protein YxjI